MNLDCGKKSDLQQPTSLHDDSNNKIWPVDQCRPTVKILARPQNRLDRTVALSVGRAAAFHAKKRPHSAPAIAAKLKNRFCCVRCAPE